MTNRGKQHIHRGILETTNHKDAALTAIRLFYSSRKEFNMKYHDLTNEAPFENLPIPLPDKLESDADFAQLFHFMISEFHLSINIYGKKYGYGDRQRLLVYILEALKNIMPVTNPEYIDNFPESLEDIKGLVAQMILTSVDYTGLHHDEPGAIQ